MHDESKNVTRALQAHITQTIRASGGWIGFDRFMALALYTPHLGYYANGSAKFGIMPDSGSDFVTAPELSPVFAQVLATQVREAMQVTGVDEIWEFGAGSGALAAQLLAQLQADGVGVRRYTIVDVSGSLRARQHERLAAWSDCVTWVDSLPQVMHGIVIGNEVLDAMPVQLLHRREGCWYERGVALGGRNDDGDDDADDADVWVWSERPTTLRPPLDIEGEHDYLTEIHPQSEAFIRTLAAHLHRGAAFFIDYGFGESEYYHAQRSMGTLVCHRAHCVDSDPLTDVGLKDLTAHVNFTSVALTAQDAGLHVLGYTSQGRFLINCGALQKIERLPLAPRAMAMKLLMEHEMGELFKVLALGAGPMTLWQPCGFVHGDRMHRL